MSCGCKSSQNISSWNDLESMTPTDPRDYIHYAAILGNIVGRFTYTDEYIQPVSGSVWIDSPITVSAEATCIANGADSGLQVADAAQWDFLHKTVNTTSALAPPLRKVVFARAGLEWVNRIPLSLGSSPSFTKLMLSIADNAATRGDAQGTIPCFQWNSGTYSGANLLDLTFTTTGRITLGLVGVNNNSTPDWSMFELDIIIVP